MPRGFIRVSEVETAPARDGRTPQRERALRAGLLLAARRDMQRLRIPHPSAAEIIQATGAGKSQSYECMHRFFDLVDQMVSRSPITARAPADGAHLEAVSTRVLEFLMAHPGAVHGGPTRRRYSDAFRRFILSLREEYRCLPAESFCRAANLPPSTLKLWLRAPRPPSDAARSARPPPGQMGARELEWIVSEWLRWSGSFASFCRHVHRHSAIPFKQTCIGNLLQRLGLRARKRRCRRSPDERALARSFVTFFPGAQWVGDGTSVAVCVDGQRFRFNVELMVDADSGAVVGASIRDTEDSAAVVTALEDGENETGHRPLSVLLDNHASNHSDAVARACDGVTLVHATRHRAQNKAHVEGAFGLFSQAAPALEVYAQSPKERARQILDLVMKTWARTLNHRPRRRPGRRGRCSSRVRQYRQARPDNALVTTARALFTSYWRRSRQAAQTRRERRDGDKRAFLERELARLGIVDPDRAIFESIARYPLDAAVAGVAIFEARRARGASRRVVGGRYLLGIVRNVAADIEDERFVESLWKLRGDLRSRLLAPLEQRRASLARCASAADTIDSLVTSALATERGYARLYWLSELASFIDGQPGGERRRHFLRAARHINATQRLRRRERYAAIRYLSEKLLPLM